MAPGEHGRVHEGIEGNGLEGGGRAACGRSLEGGRELPTVRKLEAWLERDLPDKMAGRKQGDAGPLQVQHLRSHDDAALVAVAGGEELVLQIESLRLGGHTDVERK